jgi:tetratricopeptide (TPR) repeat protein
MVPTAYAVGYKSSAPFGARKQQRNSEEAATTPKKVSSTPNFWDAVFSIYFFFFPKKQQMLSRRRNNLEGSSLLPSAVRMFECSAVCLFFALAFSTSVSAAATPPGTVSAEDVRKNIQELLKADAAAMSPDPAPVHVQVPKLQEAPHGATTNKKPAPAAKPVAVKPPASTQPAVDPELDKLRHSKLDNPMVAADGFFKAGRRAEAAILYEQGLRNDKAPDKDWALLQLGACQEQADPQAALALYGRLLAECPNSPWRRLATSRQGVLQWLIAQDVPNLLKNPTGGKSK